MTCVAYVMYSILEIDIGMVCANLLAFPAFLDHHGPGIMRRLKSYSILRRSSGREESTVSLQDNPDSQGNSTFKPFAEYSNLED